jgi:hypothetical protein
VTAEPTYAFKFLPRYRWLGLSAAGVGGGLAVLGALSVAMAPIAIGIVGAGIGAAYLLSPAWKMLVVVNGHGLEVTSPKGVRFKLAWADVVRVVAAPNGTCFVDGGSPEKSLLVPGVGAPAPYDLEHKQKLYELILQHVEPAKIERVESLEAAKLAEAAAKT